MINEEQLKILSIESELIRSYLKLRNININELKNKFLLDILAYENLDIRRELVEQKKNLDLKDIENYLYNYISKEIRDTNGMVFTPVNIVDYIVKNVVKDAKNPKIIDLSCGSGVFLYRSIDYIKKNNNQVSVIKLIENNIYGIDIIEENIRRAKILLSLLALTHGEDCEEINFNLHCGDGTKEEIEGIFGVEKFDCIVGNPPYIKIQNLTVDQKKFLKNNYKTMQSGNINIYFAFIELGMKYLRDQGELGYIIPNHFLKQKAAENLRLFLIENKYISKVIDFKGKKLFENVMTYSAILFLNKNKNEKFSYSIIHDNEKVSFDTLDNNLMYLDYKEINKETINLLTSTEIENIRMIESQPNKLEISTGIATQKDPVYTLNMAECTEDDVYYSFTEGESLVKIEKVITVPLIKGGTNIDHETKTVKKTLRIIYPYSKGINGTTVPIPEEEFEISYPYAYKYLLSKKEELSSRNSGKPTVNIWYEYGRSQALDRFEPKIIFPTNSDKPKFLLFEDKALFSNGYAIYGIKRTVFNEGESIDFEILLKVLNSAVMDYYIKNTSYMIDGGYYCYQKKYLQNFSLPSFTLEEIKWLKSELDQNLIDHFLIKKYGLKI